MVTKLRSRNTLEQDVNSLICRDKYDEAIALAKKELRRLPRSCYENWRKHWYVAHISSAYYEKRNYKVALKWGKKAFNMFPYCPLVLWHYAGALFRIGHVRAAINRYFDIYNQGFDGLAYRNWCAEGPEDAKRVRSDVRIRLAICYYSINDLPNALKWGKLFLRYYGGGIDKWKFGEKLVRKYEKELADDRQKN